MKYLSFLAIIFAFTSCMNSKTGSGNIITETRSVGSFNSISASNSVHVDVAIGATESVVVEADDNIMPYLETNVSGSTLKVKLKGINSLTNVTIKVHVTMPEVNRLSAETSSEIVSKGILTGSGPVDLDANTSARIEVSLDVPVVNIKSNTSADIVAKGRTKSVDAEVSTSGSVKAAELRAEDVKAEASTSGDIDVFASVSINAKATTSGSINYKGGAASKIIKEETSGSVTAN